MRSEIENRIVFRPNQIPGVFRYQQFRLLVWTIVIVIFGACEQDVTPLAPAKGDTASGTPSASEEHSVERLESVASEESAFSKRPKRIILISLDTVGARHVGGYSDARTPNIEKIAKDGVRFDRFYSASTYTLPSHMSMLTGLDPIEHGVVNLPARLAPDVPTLATKLAEAGYTTKAVTEGGFIGQHYGFGQGFQEVEERAAVQVAMTSIWGVLDWMRAKQDSPYFLFVHTYVPHAPYGGFAELREQHPELDLPNRAEIKALEEKYNTKPIEVLFPASREIPDRLRQMCTFYNNMREPDFDLIGCGDRRFKGDFLEDPNFESYREGLVVAYRGAIRRGDRMVGQIRDLLIELNQLPDTLLIVTSDHGDGMFEHSLHGHDYLPFDEVVKVPLVLSFPNRFQGGRVVPGLAWHLDLLPTILSIAGIPFDPGLQGEDLSTAMMNDGAGLEDRAIYPLLLRPTNRTHLPMLRMALRGDFKFIEGHHLFGDAEGLLFNVVRSPSESENLRRTDERTFEVYKQLASDYDSSLTPGEPVHQETFEPISPFPGEVEPFEISDEVKHGLAALGYLIDGEPLKPNENSATSPTEGDGPSQSQ